MLNNIYAPLNMLGQSVVIWDSEGLCLGTLASFVLDTRRGIEVLFLTHSQWWEGYLENSRHLLKLRVRVEGVDLVMWESSG